jgi:predicted dehydrogenase
MKAMEKVNVAMIGGGFMYGETKIIECYQFYDAMVNAKQPSPSFRDGYIINCIADAIDHSSTKQAWVKVDR